MSKLKTNVHVADPETGVGKWYGPDYPQNGEPPSDAVTNPVVFEETTVTSDLRFRADDFAQAGDEPRETTHPEESEQSDTPDDSPPRPTPARRSTSTS